MPPKRKAKDAASPVRPPASRARLTRTSKASPATDGDDSDALFTKPAKRARGTASRTVKRDDDEDDFGNSSRANPPGTSNDNLTDIYTALLQTTTATGAQTTATLPTPKDNPLFEQTQHLLRLSRAVLACHRAADRDSRAQQESLASPRETWARDEEGMRKLLGYGKAFGERVVEGWVTPHDHGKGGDGEEAGEGPAERADYGGGGKGLSEAENLARGLFEWRRKGRGLGMGKGEESWGVAARRQMVALAGVVRTLPSKEA